MRSNLEQWKQLQEDGYFETHPCYNGLSDINSTEAVSIIGEFTSLNDSMRIVVIGCGYGRETLALAPRVGHVWGIDVSARILNKAVSYLKERGVSNFTPVEAERYKDEIPVGIDLVFSVVVMQHLTRDLVRDYFKNLGGKLAPGGKFVVQFLEDVVKHAASSDADLHVHEPSVSWTAPDIVELARHADLKLMEIKTQLVTPTSLWHFVHLSK